MEHLLHVRLQHQHRRSLRHPTDHVGYAQNPGPALLGEFHRSDRAGKIATRHHAIPQPVEVVLQPRFELLDRHTVGPGRSAITLHLQPRIPDQPLGDVVRLALQPRLTHAIPPFRLISLVRQDDPAPSLPNPLRYAGGSQLLRTSPPASPHRYSAPHGFRRLEFSLSPPANRPAAVSGTPSHVPYESQDRAHAAYMPDPTWAVNGYPPGSSRDRFAASVLRSSTELSTRQRQRACTHRSSSRPTPDAIIAAPFPTTLSTTVFS